MLYNYIKFNTFTKLSFGPEGGAGYSDAVLEKPKTEATGQEVKTEATGQEAKTEVTGQEVKTEVTGQEKTSSEDKPGTTSDKEDREIKSENDETKSQLDESKLSAEELNKYNEIKEKIKKFEEQLAGDKEKTDLKEKQHDTYVNGATTKVTFGEMGKDKEYPDLMGKINDLKGEIGDLTDKEKAIKRTIDTIGENKLSPDELKKMQEITPKEFLNISPAERLAYISTGNVKAEELKEGGKKDVEFLFTYDGEFNRELYNQITAGQVLPETARTVQVEGVEYTRNGISGEFFTAEGTMLVVDDGTKLEVTKFGTQEELQNLHDKTSEEVKDVDEKYKDLAIMSSEKGYDSKFIIELFGEKLAKEGNIDNSDIEETFTDIARAQNQFTENYPGEKAFEENGKPTEKFAGFITNTFDSEKVNQVAEFYGYNPDTMKDVQKINYEKFGGGPIKMENVNIEGMSKEEVQQILQLKTFKPGSKEAQVLFQAACQSSQLPEQWSKCEGLHRILSHESAGQVGRLNYTIKGMTPETFKQQATNSTSNNPIGAKSTASGLGQLLLSNVDKYYPDGRAGIGNPLSEAVGMIRYIKDRYGDPETCWGIYGKTGTYNHPEKGIQQKTFKEGY